MASRRFSPNRPTRIAAMRLKPRPCRRRKRKSARPHFSSGSAISKRSLRGSSRISIFCRLQNTTNISLRRADDIIWRMRGRDVTRENLLRYGFDTPILVDGDEQQLGLVLSADVRTLDGVERAAGIFLLLLFAHFYSFALISSLKLLHRLCDGVDSYRFEKPTAENDATGRSHWLHQGR